jgi:hypothetical protein
MSPLVVADNFTELLLLSTRTSQPLYNRKALATSKRVLTEALTHSKRVRGSLHSSAKEEFSQVVSRVLHYGNESTNPVLVGF